MMHVLIVQTGKYKGKRVKLATPEVIVGRDEDAGIRIASAEVSRQHCVLVARGESVLVRDLASRNGTFVDGVPVDGERLMPPGGVLSVGPMSFKLDDGGAAAPAASTPIARLRKPTAAEKLSDDDIASWLSHTDQDSGELDLTDTVVLSSGSPHLRPDPAPAPLPIKKREFTSMAEEAADIIRRHQDMLRAQEEAEG